MFVIYPKEASNARVMQNRCPQLSTRRLTTKSTLTADLLSHNVQGFPQYTIGSFETLLHPSGVLVLFIRINMPDNIVRQPNDLIPSLLGHPREPFCLGLVLESVRGEVDT